MIAAELASGLSGPLLKLEQQILRSHQPIEHWLRGQWLEHARRSMRRWTCATAASSSPRSTPTCSRAGSTISIPIPAAVHAGGHDRGAETSARTRAACCSSRKTTRATHHYLQNVAVLQKIIAMAGMKVRIGTLIPEIQSPTEMELPNGGKLLLEPLVRKGNRIGVEGFDPCSCCSTTICRPASRRSWRASSSR